MAEPLVPVTVTVYTPAWPEHDSAEFPEDVRLVTPRVQDRPVVGEIVLVRVTVPVNPLA